MIERKTVVEQIEVKPETGHLQVRFVKLLIEDGAEIHRGYHRIVLEPDMDLTEAARLVNASLAQLGEAAVEDFHWERVKRHADLARTPEVVEKWTQQKEARLAEEKIARQLDEDRRKAEAAAAKKAFEETLRAALLQAESERQAKAKVG